MPRRIIVRRAACLLVLAALVLPVVGCQTPAAVLRQQAYEAYDAHHYDQADRILTQAVNQDPANWHGQYVLGKIRLIEHRPWDAQLHLKRAWDLHSSLPEVERILDALAEALSQQHKTDAIYNLLRHATQEYGTTDDFLRQGKYLAKMGDVDGAKLAYEKAGRLCAPSDARPYVGLADLYESVGDSADAIVALRQAEGLLPNDPDIAQRLRKYGIVPGPAAALPINKR